MRRRDFITVFGGAAALSPFVVRAQSAMPVIGRLGGGSPNKTYIAAFLNGLREGGYVEDQNVAVESRFADGQYDQLPTLAADLARRGVSVIFAEGSSASGRAAKQATATIPIVFLNGDDPIRSGLVSSINRPEANVTGVSVSRSWSAATFSHSPAISSKVTLSSGRVTSAAKARHCFAFCLYSSGLRIVLDLGHPCSGTRAD